MLLYVFKDRLIRDMTGINTVKANILIRTDLYSSSVCLSWDVWVVLVRFYIHTDGDTNKEWIKTRTRKKFVSVNYTFIPRNDSILQNKALAGIT